jgi:large subunit ribosomal protein L30e
MPLLLPTLQSKKATESINSRLALVMKSGKYSLGYKTALKTLRSGKGVSRGEFLMGGNSCTVATLNLCVRSPCLYGMVESCAPFQATLPLLPDVAAKLIIISSNIQPVRKSELEYYAMLAKTGVHHYSGSELSYAAGSAGGEGGNMRLTGSSGSHDLGIV